MAWSPELRPARIGRRPSGLATGEVCWMTSRAHLVHTMLASHDYSNGKMPVEKPAPCEFCVSAGGQNVSFHDFSSDE